MKLLGKIFQLALLCLISSSFAVSGPFNAQLQGQSFGSIVWQTGNLTGWQELDFIPVRVAMTGGPVTNKVISVQFDHTKTQGTTVLPGIQNLINFTPSANVTFVSGPTLSAPPGADTWTYTFTVNITTSLTAYVEFRARLSAGAHIFTGSSLALSGSPSLGTLQVAKPAPKAGSPDLTLDKVGPSLANPNQTISYTLNYTNKARTTATGVQLSDVLPSVVSFVSCSGNCTVAGNTVTWDLGDLPTGASGSVSYQVVVSNGVTNGQTFQNSASIYSAENDANLADNLDKVVTTVTGACIPVSILSNPQSQVKCSGDSAVFGVQTTGSTPFQYQWRKNGFSLADGASISGATTATLTIRNLGVTDIGSYDLTVKNACGSATSSPATLDVNPGTQILRNPAGTSACAGSPATFTVSAQGSGLSFQWRKGGSPIGGATDSAYTIPAVASGDAGSYDVVVTGTCGSATSSAAILTVNTAPSVTGQPNPQVACAGIPVSFSAAASGSPAPSIQWQVSTDGGANFSNLQNETGPSLSFTAGAGQNGYQYRAVFTNSCGTATTDPAALTVNAAPQVTSQPSNQTACESGSANFSVTATGSGLTYQWRKGGQNLADGGSLSGVNTPSLTINPVAASDSGLYDVVVGGTCSPGAISSSATLTVNRQPLVTSNPENDTTCDGSTAAFTASATGRPAASIQWEVSTDGGSTFNPLAGEMGATLSFPTAAIQNGYRYRATFSNSCGTASTASAILVVYSQPTQALAGSDQVLTDTLASLNANTPASGSGHWSLVSGSGTILAPSSPHSGVSGLSLGQNVFRWTISNGVCPSSSDDVMLTRIEPSISVNDTAVNEGNSGTVSMVFTVRLSIPSSLAVTAHYSTADGSATVADADYDAANGIVTFNPGETAATIAVPVRGDTKLESNEEFFVNLSEPSNATVADAQGIGTILNDDGVPLISIADAQVAEGNSGTTPMTFAVTLSNASSQKITVNYSTADGSALAADNDYSPASGTVTFTPGDTLETVTVLVNGDTKLEPDESFTVNLAGATNSAIADGQGAGTIRNDDTPPSASVNTVSLPEGNSGLIPFQFTVSLSAMSGMDASFHWATSDGSAAVSDGDYQANSGDLIIPAGSLTGTFTVQVNGDLKYEPDESLYVTLSDPVNALISNATGIGAIQNDDQRPQLTIDDVALDEGNSGTTVFRFTLTLSNPSSETITVDAATSDGTATLSDADYQERPASPVTFNPGEVSKTVDINVNGDLKFETDETFHVDLSNPVNASILDGVGDGTIRNDDRLPYISIDDVSHMEGNSGLTPFDFTVRLSTSSVLPVTVQFLTKDGSARMDDNDYGGTSGVVTFAPGETTQTISISVIGDILNEADETFSVALSQPVNSALFDSIGVGTILNDDPMPCLTIDDIQDVEGNGGMTAMNFHVSLSAPSGQVVQVDFASEDGTAIAGSDYIPNNGILIFYPGDLSKLVSVLSVGDYAKEPDETFFVDLTNPIHATICDGRGVATIINDDSIPGIGINDIEIAEGDTGLTRARFTLTLSIADTHRDTVNFSTADWTALVSDHDYVPATGSIAFAPGETTKVLDMFIRGDSIVEPDEAFLVNLHNSNVYITNAQGSCTILNDDGVRTISVNDIRVNEGTGSPSTAAFTVSLSAPSIQPVSMLYTTVDGTAKAGDQDYTEASGTVTIDPGQTSKQILVQVTGDNIREPDETFFIRLSAAQHATLADSEGMCTIADDDPMPAITIGDVSLNEGNTGTSNAVFVVSLSNPSSQPVSVQWQTLDGTATDADGDYISGSGTLVFDPLQAQKNLLVSVRGDYAYEPNEQFSVRLFNPANATLADSTGTGTILNDDGRVCIRTYDDRNHNQTLDAGEEPIPGVQFALAGPGLSVNKATDENGEVCLTGLSAGKYTLAETLPDGYDYSLPPESPISLDYRTTLDTTIIWLNTPLASSQSFRTARSEDWATARNAATRLRSERRKADKVQARLVIASPSAVSGFIVKFNMKFTGAVSDADHPGVVLATITSEHQHSVSASLPAAAHVQIEGYGSIGKYLKVTVVWQTSPRPTTVSYNNPAQFVTNIPRLPMPNLHNVGEELFPKSRTQTNVAFPAGLLVGSPRGPRHANSVLHKSYRTVQGSFNYRGRLHTKPARCLDFFDNSGYSIGTQLRSLPPNKQDNSLFAELLALRLNVAASAAGKFPNGLGELTYLNPAEADNLFNNFTVNHILVVADTVLSCARLTSMRPEPTYDELYRVVRQINSAFAGPVDSVSFSTGTILTGVRKLKEIPYLVATPGSIPLTIKSDQVVEDVVPTEFSLEQNYPNPFNPTTMIQFELPEPAAVTLTVYNSLGQQVALLMDHQALEDGEQEVEFAGSGLASGVYFYTLKAQPLEEGGQSFTAVKKMMLLK